MNKKGEKGFTLIELLLVITILALISAAVLVGLGGVRSRGRDTRRIVDLRQVQNALEIYFDKNRQYPVTNSGSPSGRWNEMGSIVLSAGIGVSSLPKDPLNRSPYEYDYKDGNSSLNYVMKATLENSDHPSLRDDIDGTVYGIDCTDPAYCIQI
ncbi:MAG: type II secretion system protein [Parcubacteria group bacterium]|nr:type II secretion system protein [Parcubacteria group bacterium]